MQQNNNYPYPYRRSNPSNRNGTGGMVPAAPRRIPGYTGGNNVIIPGTMPTGTDVVPPGVPFQEGPPTTQDVGYIQSFLARNIGQYVKIEFILGTNMLVDREGVIVEVGTNYVVIQEPETDDLLMCDLYSIKFVRIYL